MIIAIEGFGYRGHARPVFDLDSVGLLARLREMKETRFVLGAVTTNFKLRENEVVPQYLKLEKKIASGAQFIITQIGFDARKQHEQLLYMKRRQLEQIPLIGSVYLLNARPAAFFGGGNVPGVVVSEALLQTCRREAGSPDKGRAFFGELAAKQVAVLKGLGYRGVYLSGIHHFADLERILEIAPYRADRLNEVDPLTVRRMEFWAGSLLAIIAFFLFGGNRFNSLKIIFWLVSLGLMVRAFLLPGQLFATYWERAAQLWRTRRLHVTLTGWTLLVLSILGLVLFFRFYQLNSVPPEMVSDHAEKLLDIYDVTQGETRIFFPRNTGREFFQMYLTAGIVQLLNTGFSFWRMKLGMVVRGHSFARSDILVFNGTPHRPQNWCVLSHSMIWTARVAIQNNSSSKRPYS